MSSALTPGQSLRTGGALVLANARYWSSVAPLTRVHIAHWERRAQAVADPRLKALATEKLSDERFNVEVAATFATLAPRATRAHVVKAIVAAQIAYDYLDVLGEQPPDKLRATDDGGYLLEMVDTVTQALERLPAAATLAAVMQRVLQRCGEAQTLIHAAVRDGDAELQRWATREAAASATGRDQATDGLDRPGVGRSGHGWAEHGRSRLGWPAYLAGASAGVLALHALIAAAADRHTTLADAEAIDAAYLRIGALTMLDSLNDREQDLAMGERGYIRHYEDREQLAEGLAVVAHEAAAQVRALPHAAHHTMALLGVVAYYGSAPAAHSPLVAPVTARLRTELGPLMAPTLAIMRAWRLAKKVRGWYRRSTTPDNIVSSAQMERMDEGRPVLQRWSTNRGKA
jgi:tetraprenyl-beta-curcumene synthase